MATVVFQTGQNKDLYIFCLFGSKKDFAFICTKTNSLAFGNQGTYQAVWGICTAFSMKQCDTVNKTTDSFTHYSVQWRSEQLWRCTHISNLSEWPFWQAMLTWIQIISTYRCNFQHIYMQIWICTLTHDLYTPRSQRGFTLMISTHFGLLFTDMAYCSASQYVFLMTSQVYRSRFRVRLSHCIKTMIYNQELDRCIYRYRLVKESYDSNPKHWKLLCMITQGGIFLWCIILSHYKYKNITPASPMPL